MAVDLDLREFTAQEIIAIGLPNVPGQASAPGIAVQVVPEGGDEDGTSVFGSEWRPNVPAFYLPFISVSTFDPETLPEREGTNERAAVWHTVTVAYIDAKKDVRMDGSEYLSEVRQLIRRRFTRLRSKSFTPENDVYVKSAIVQPRPKIDWNAWFGRSNLAISALNIQYRLWEPFG